MYILTLENKEGHSVNSDFVVGSFNQKEVLHQNLKQADDSIRLQVPFSADIWNFINANKLIKAKITEDGAAYFTGFVRPGFDFSKIQRFQPIQLELVNATYITSFYEIEESIAFKDTTLGTIVSNLLERAEIIGQDTSFLDEPIIFDIIEEGTNVKDALSQILFEYGYFWDFDKNGEFTVQKIYNENVTPSVILDGSNILEKAQVSKKEQEFDRVEVEYEHLEKFENILLFQDNTGSGTNKGCFIELLPGKYLGQVEGETSYDITYDSDKGKIIWVDDASLSILSNNKNKIQSTFINKNTKGNLSIYNADTRTNYILLLEVWGTAYINTIESATIKVGQEGKSKSIKSKYIHSKEAAKNFAKMYYDWGKSCDYVISLQSKLNLDVGTIVEVNTAGKIIGRVIEKTTKLDGKPYTYKIEAIEEYELPQITSSILRKSSPIGTAARGTGILKIDTAPDAYTTPVSGITPAYRISKDIVKSQSKVNDVYTGDILQYSYYQYQVILVADDYVYTAERTSIRGSVGATGATGNTGATGAPGTKTFFSDYPRTWTNEQWNECSTVGYTDTWSNSTTAGMRIGDTFVVTATLSEKGNSKGQIFTEIIGIDSSDIVSSKTVASLIGERGETGATGATGATGQRGGIDLAITTAPSAYTTAIGGFTPSYRIALSTVKTQSGISTVYVGDTLVYGVYRYPVGYVDSSYVYTAARTSVKGDTGTKTFFSDYSRTWTNEQWNECSTVGYTDTWSNSTTAGMRIGDTFVVTATLSEKGNSKGQIFTEIIGIDSSNNTVSSKTVASLIGERGETGASSRTIAYRINYSAFTTAENGEIYVCGYNSAGDQADVPGYVIVNGNIHFIKGMFNPNVPTNGYVVAEKDGTIDSPKTPLFAFYDWGKEKYYKIENTQETSGKTWEQLFTEITNTSNYIVLGKVSSPNEEGPLEFEETTPCLLSSTTEDEENFTYQGVVATTTDMSTSITPYKFSQDAYGNWTKTILNTKTIKKWSFVLCMNATTPNSSTGDPVMKVFNGTWWYEIKTTSAYYSSLQSMMAGDLPAVAGYYYTLGLAVPSICGTYIKTLTSNKAFINELFANDIVVGNKIRSSNNNFSIDYNGNATLKSGTIGGISIDRNGISIPFTPKTGLRCYVEYNKDDTGTTKWTTDLSAVYNSNTNNGTVQYIMRFGYKAPGLSTQIPVYNMFKSIVGASGAQYAFSTVDSPYTVPSSWTDITKNSFPRTDNVDTKYKYLFIKLGYIGPNSPEIYALPCYTTDTRHDGFEINSDGSAIFTGNTRFEGGIGIICDAKDVSRDKANGLLTITYHFPIDFKIYDVFLFLETNNSNQGTVLLYKFTCVQNTKSGRPAMNTFTTYNDTSIYNNVIDASVENDNAGYNSQQYPNGYIDKNNSWLKKVVIRQKNNSLSIAAIKAVLIPYIEAD